MRSQSATQQDSSIGINPQIDVRMPWRVVAVMAMPGFHLHVRFIDGTEGTVDLSGLIHSPGAGVFASLQNASLFNQVFVEQGAVTWPGEIDLAPDAMYAEIKKTGTWVLQ